jgi:integrase
MLNENTFCYITRRLGVAQYTAHGFRSAFRDWCGEHTNFPREVAEAALAHSVGDKSEQAYRRGDALSKRRKLMHAWAAYCSKTAPIGATITPLRKVGANA